MPGRLSRLRACFAPPRRIPYHTAGLALGLATALVGVTSPTLLPVPVLAAPAGNEVQGVTIEPSDHSARITLRCAGSVRPVLRMEGRTRVILELPGTLPGSLPPELPLETSGIRTLRPRKTVDGVLVEFDLERPLTARIVSPAGARDVVVEIGADPPAPGPGPEGRAERGVGSGPLPPDPVRVGGDGGPEIPTRDQLPGKGGPSAGAVADGTPRLVGVVVASNAGKLQIRLKATGRTVIRHGYVKGKLPRCYVDVEGVLLGKQLGVLRAPQGCAVQGIRVAQHSHQPPVCRVVLDLKPGTGPQIAPDDASDLVIVIPSDPEGVPTPPPAMPQLPPGKRPLIVAVDAGHGGGDPGACGARGLFEKAVTLDVALRLAEYLRGHGCEVRLSRSGDSTLPPPQRLAWLRSTPSDLLVSVHCDSVSGRPERCGTTTYFHQGHGASRELGELVQGELVRNLRTPDMGVRSDFTRYDTGFYILRNAARPAVLVETGYISNSATAAQMSKPDHRQNMAEAIGSGILEYLRKTTGTSHREAAR